MNSTEPAVLATQIAADLTWLEGFAREREELHASVVPLRLGAALLRNQVAAHLSGRGCPLLNIAVVGGAGTGKSTVANFLIGRTVAETNAQAGFTRHPVAYLGDSATADHLLSNRLGPLTPISGPCPSDRDEDVFQVRQIGLPGNSSAMETLALAIVWDCPDMTTWKANQYQTRLVEAIGLADLVVYVASDERYNDAWPTQYLRYILQAGKPVIACLTKMKPDQAGPLVEHFREEVIARIPECAGVASTVALAQLTLAEQSDPAGVGGVARAKLLEPLQWWLQHPQKTRSDSVKRAIRFLGQFQETLLAPARHDLSAVATWETWVEDGKRTFVERYQNEYLCGEQFPRFNAAMVRLIELLELPGAGQYVSKTLDVLRMPYRWVKGWFKKPDVAPPHELQVLMAGFQGWLDRLRRETLLQPEKHPVWSALRQAFHDKLDAPLLEDLQKRSQEFSQKQVIETENTARAIYEDLEKNPTALNTLRGFKFTVEAASLTGVVLTAGTHFLLYPLLLPIIVSITQGLTEALGKKYVDAQREKARERQRELFEQTLAQPLGSELSAWPTKLVPALPELRSIVDRLPKQLSALGSCMEQAKKEPEGVAA